MLSTPYIRKERRMIGDDKSVSPSSNWSDLPPDLLRLLYRKLYDTFDFVYFRAVCKSWLAAAPLSDHPPQLPLILQHSFLSSEMKFYSLHTSKTYRIQVPNARNKMFFGQSQGYLVTDKTGCNDTSLILLNPFTRDEIPFPFHGFKFCRPVHVNSADHIQNSADVGIYMNMDISRFVGFWKYDQNNELWALKGCLSSREEADNQGSQLFPHFKTYSTTIIDYTNGYEFKVSPPHNDFRKRDFYCLGDGAGSFIGIQRHFHSGTKFSFEVYRLHEKLTPPCWVKLSWVKVSNIGDLVIFLNDDSTGFCLSASAFNGISGNSIYFLERVIGGGSLVGLYELAKDESQVIGQLDSYAIWIVPNVY